MATKKKKPVEVEEKKEEKVEIKEQAAKKVELTERQKFHQFFMNEYLAKAPERMSEPHHPDNHGFLGYETNSFDYDVGTDKNGKPIKITVNGFCDKCSLSALSAKEAYEQANAV